MPPANRSRAHSQSRRPQADGSSQARSGLLRSSTVMAAGTLVSRLLGLVRALLLASVLGLLSLSSSAFATANTVPNSIYLLIAGGFLNAALVPAIVRVTGEQRSTHAPPDTPTPPVGGAELSRIVTWSVTLLLAATVPVVAAAPLVPDVLAGAFDPQTSALTVALAYWCLPQVFFYGLYAVLGQVLNARSVFGPFMWAPVANNLVAIAGLLLYVRLFGADAGRAPPGAWSTAQIAVLAGSATLGVAAQALVLLVPLRRTGIRLRPRWRRTSTPPATAASGLRRVAGWALAAAAVSQLGYVVTSNVANSTAPGHAGRAAYDNAYTLLMLPHSLLTVSFATALFTRLSATAARGDTAAVAVSLSRAVRLVSFFTVPASAALVVLGEDVVRVLYPGNDTTETHALAAVVSVIALALVPLSVQHLLQRGFYAFQDARTPFVVQLAVVGVGAGVAIVGRATLPDDRVILGVAFGLAVGLTTGGVLSARCLRTRLSWRPGAELGAPLLRLLAAGAGSGLLARFMQLTLRSAGVTGYRGSLLVVMCSSTTLGIGYLVLCRLLAPAELRMVAQNARSTLHRPRRPHMTPGARRTEPAARPRSPRRSGHRPVRATCHRPQLPLCCCRQRRR